MGDEGGGTPAREREDEKSIRDLKELSAPGNSFVGCDAKRMTGTRAETLPYPKMEGQR